MILFLRILSQSKNGLETITYAENSIPFVLLQTSETT